MNFHLEESKFSSSKLKLPDIPPPPDQDDKPEIEPPKEPIRKLPDIRAQTIPFYPKLPIILENKIYLNPNPNDVNLHYEMTFPQMQNNEILQIPVYNLEHELKTRNIAQKDKTIHLTRKIVKNFGKAIASFACCDKALLIVNKLIKNNPQKKDSFKNFVYDHKEFIEGNRRLMQLLTITSEDDKDTKRNKSIFKLLAEIFMKRYVQQWLWNSKLVNKELHASLIKDMRRRIKHPELLEHLSE